MKRLGWIGIVVMALGIALTPAWSSAQSTAKKPSTTTASKRQKEGHALLQRNQAKLPRKGTAAKGQGTAETHQTSSGHSSTHHRAKQGSESASTQSRHVHGHGATSIGHLPQPTAESRRLNSAFIASEKLRPMAQQLVTDRSPAAYAGVLAYAASHPGEAAASASSRLATRTCWIAVMPMRRMRSGRQVSMVSALDDYANYLAAQAAVDGNRPQECHPAIGSILRSPSEQRF